MRSGQGRSEVVPGLRATAARRWAPWLAILAVCLGGPASANDRWRVLLVRPEDPELMARVQGQTRDLGFLVEATSEAPDLPVEVGAQSDALAREHAARFVARVQRAARGGLEVRIYDAEQRTLRVRGVPAREHGERFATSAELEAVALVMRSELFALVQSDRARMQIGRAPPPPPAATAPAPSRTATPDAATATPERITTAPEEATTAPEPIAPAPVAAPEPASEPLADFASGRELWTVRGGVRGSAPISGALVWSPLLGLRAQLDWLELGVNASTSLPLALVREGVRIELKRHGLALDALALVPWPPRLRWLIGLGGGVVLYARDTDSVSAELEPAASKSSWSATLGVQTELQWMITPGIGLSLGAGLDLVLWRTRFAYPGDLEPTPEIARLNSLEPWATATLLVFID